MTKQKKHPSPLYRILAEAAVDGNLGSVQTAQNLLDTLPLDDIAEILGEVEKLTDFLTELSPDLRSLVEKPGGGSSDRR
jgi:hypothetical protein